MCVVQTDHDRKFGMRSVWLQRLQMDDGRAISQSRSALNSLKCTCGCDIFVRPKLRQGKLCYSWRDSSREGAASKSMPIITWPGNESSFSSHRLPYLVLALLHLSTHARTATWISGHRGVDAGPLHGRPPRRTAAPTTWGDTRARAPTWTSRGYSYGVARFVSPPWRAGTKTTSAPVYICLSAHCRCSRSIYIYMDVHGNTYVASIHPSVVADQ
jgi:hypothetical protein